MQALELFGKAARDWFEQSIGRPTAVQEQGWPQVASGQSVLISAPTGTGKTLAAFLWHIDRLLQLAEKNSLEDKVYVLYISPLKALGNDIACNLQRPLRGIEQQMKRSGADLQPVRTAMRNGDTPASERKITKNRRSM